MERFYLLVVGWPKTLLSVLLGLTCIATLFAKDIRFDSSIDGLLGHAEPARRYYDGVRDLFGSDEVAIVGVVADDIYTELTLSLIRRLTLALENVEGVERVLSLANALDPVADVVDPPLLMPEIPVTGSGMARLRHTVLDRPIYVKNLVSSDGTAAAINIFFDDMSEEEFLARGIDEKIQNVLDVERSPAGPDLYFAGLPRFKIYVAQAIKRDLRRFVPLVLLVIVVVLFCCFRSVVCTLLATLTILASLVWTLCLMVLCGGNIGLGTIALPPLILVLGTAYSLHMIADYREEERGEGANRQMVLEMLRRAGPSIFLTSLTTILGFLALTTSSLTSIREMGLYSSIGIFIAFLLTVTVIPAFFVVFGLPSRQKGPFAPWISDLFGFICLFAIRRRVWVLSGALIITVLSVWQAFFIRADSDLGNFFPPDDPIMQAERAISEKLVGTMAFYVMVDADERDALKQLDTLRRIRDLQHYIDSLSGVDKTVSFVDYCEMLDRGSRNSLEVIGGGDGSVSVDTPVTTFWENPEQLRAVMQIVAGSPSSFRSVADPDFSRSSILVRTSLSGSREISELVTKIVAYSSDKFPPELQVKPTGNLILITATTDDIIAGQIRSLSLAAGVIFVIMATMFLSLRVGLVAMIPNVFPIIVFFGLLGTTGAMLNLGTSIIASIALGIAVDNTVHIMTRLSAEVKLAVDDETALVRTVSNVAIPSLFASIILCLGFLVLSLSSFVPVQNFGILSAITITVAFGADVVLLPSLLATTKIITLWELLYLKLGKDPQQTIPLFDGLRPVQAKIVTLMGEFRSFRKGEHLFRQGELGREMYVLIEGRAEAKIHVGVESRLLRTMKRGDVIGEMALIRHNVRTADVVAVDNVESIVVNERFLSRMQKRYPRIGARIFLNIAKILSDRLEEMSRRNTS